MVGPFDHDDADDARGPGGVLPEITKRILSAGVGAYFLTEDAIRRAVGETKLPGEVAEKVTDRLVSGARRRRDDLLGFVKREITNVVQNIDIQKELRRFLREHTVRINAEIEFVPREPGAAPRAASDDAAAPPSDADDGPHVELDFRVKGAPQSDDGSRG